MGLFSSFINGKWFGAFQLPRQLKNDGQFIIGCRVPRGNKKYPYWRILKRTDNKRKKKKIGENKGKKKKERNDPWHRKAVCFSLLLKATIPYSKSHCHCHCCYLQCRSWHRRNQYGDSTVGFCQADRNGDGPGQMLWHWRKNSKSILGRHRVSSRNRC